MFNIISKVFCVFEFDALLMIVFNWFLFFYKMTSQPILNEFLHSSCKIMNRSSMFFTTGMYLQCSTVDKTLLRRLFPFRNIRLRAKVPLLLHSTGLYKIICYLYTQLLFETLSESGLTIQASVVANCDDACTTHWENQLYRSKYW